MRGLIAREWRENRALILSIMLLAPVASFLVKWLVVGIAETCVIDSLLYVTPAAFTVFVLAISADLASRDITSGRCEFFAALPMSPARLWSAKSIFLISAAALFLVSFLLLEVMILHLIGKDLTLLTGHDSYRIQFPLIAALGAGALTFFFSTLLDRGIAAALAGFGLVAGARFLIQEQKEYFWRGATETGVYLPASIVLIVAALLAAGAAFLWGRVHLREKLRRLAIGGSVLLLIVVPTVVWAGVSAQAWFDVDPAADDLLLGGGTPTPDGRWALISASRAGRHPFGLRTQWRQWAVNLETGLVREYATEGASHLERQWDWRTPDQLKIFHWEDLTGLKQERQVLVIARDPGRLIIHREEHPRGERPFWLRTIYDLDAGKPISTRVVDHSEVLPAGRKDWPAIRERGSRVLVEIGANRATDPVWSPHSRPTGWSVLVCGRSEGRKARYGVLRFDTREIVEFQGFPLHTPDDPSGYALSLDQEILRTPLDDRPPERIDIGEKLGFQFSPGGAHSLVFGSKGTFLLRAADGSVRRVFGPITLVHHPRALWSADSTSFLVRGEKKTIRGVIAGDQVTVQEVKISPRIEWAACFDGRRVFGFSDGRRTFHVGDLEGGSRQLLPVVPGTDREVQ